MQVKDLRLKRALRTALLVLLLSVVGMGKMYAQSFTVNGLKYSVNDDGITVSVTGPNFSGEGFENGIPSDWAIIDADGDGYCWELASWANHTGNYGMASASYIDEVGDVTPDNYLVSGPINFTTNTGIRFYACAYDANYVAEHFGVAVSLGSQTNVEDFSTITEWTMTAKGNVDPKKVRGLRDQTTWYEYTVDLSGFDGQTGYVAIRHFNCTGQWYLNVDDVYIGNDYDEPTLSNYLNIPENVSFEGVSYGVTTIENSAFKSCTFYSGNLTIGNSVTTIGSEAFYGCSGFTGNLTIPNSVTTIGDYAFYGCNGLATLTIGNSVATIGGSAFYCPNLNAVYYTGDIEGWCNISFSNTSSTPLSYAHNLYVENELVTDLVVPETVTQINQYAFYGVTCLTSLAISNSVTTIGNYAFYGCSGLTGSLTIPNSVTTIGGSAFFGCRGFTGSLTIPNSVTTIGGSAFFGCSGFTGSLTIPNSVTTIGNGAFAHCSGLTGSLTISNSVASIGNWAFQNCNGFYSITSFAETPPILGEGSFAGWNLNTPVFVPCGFEEVYSSLSWGGFRNYYEMCGGTVTVVANPVEGGMVTGGGTFETGQICTVMATEYEGYSFSYWELNGTKISSDAEYSFYVAGEMTLVAHFLSEENIVFADTIVKDICVSHWDTNGDGELSYVEAALVIDLNNYFNGNMEITSFEELQFFIGLTTIRNGAFYNCSNLSGSLYIPNSVSSIGDGAFYGCSGLTGSLTIPNSVTTIGFNAFQNCSGFTGSLTIPNSVTTIGGSAFSGCSGFTGSLTIPNSVTTIGYEVFMNCSGFTGDLTIPNSVTTIGNYAFYDCSGFTGDLTIPNSVTTIDNYAFADCSGFTGILTIPNSVTTLGEGAFYSCNGFTGTLTIPNSLTVIEESAFRECRGITGLIIPNAITSIGQYAFCYCTGLTGSLTIPDSVATIGIRAFQNCNGFSSVIIIAETPPSLGWQAFYPWSSNNPAFVPCGFEEGYASQSWGGFSDYNGLCGGMVTIMADPEECGIVTGGGQIEANQLCTVTAIANEGYVFSNWTFNGTVVSVEAEYTFYVAGDMTLVAHFVQDGNITFADANVKSICVSHWDTNGDGELSYVEAALVTDLNYYFNGNAEITSFEELQFFIGLTTISNYAFYNCSNLSGSLYIPNFVSSIGYYAFYGCSGLTGSLTIPNSVTTIGFNAFQNCSGFTGDLTIGNSVTTIGNGAFLGCSALTGSLTIPNSVTTIGEYAFSGCSGFTGDLTIPNSVITIGGYAFSGCSGLTGSLTIPNSVTTIGNSAFYGCSFNGLDIDMISIPNSFYSIVGGSYSGNLTIGNSVIMISSSAFSGCSGFTGSLTLGNSVTTVGSKAFYGCSGFTGSLTLGNSVTTVGSEAFRSCSGFTGSLTIGNSVTTIGNSAFWNCSGFTGSLTIPNSVTTIGGGAFSHCSGFSSVTSLAETPPTLGSDPFFPFNSGKPVFVPCGFVEEYAQVSWGGFDDFIGYCGGTVTAMAVPEEGGTVTGGGQIESDQLCTLTAIANEGYTFSNWTFNGTIVSVEAEYTFYVAGDMTLVAHFMQDGNITFADANVKAICVAIWDINGDDELSYAEAAAVTSIGQVFRENTEITSFEELQYFIGLTTIRDDAFYNCSNLSGSLYIPNSVTTIGSRAFENCSGFTGSLTIPNSVTTIGSGAFWNCSGFTGDLTIPNSVITIGNSAFYGCSSLTGSLTIPNSVTYIEGRAFENCSGFTGSLTIPNSVTEISDYAFSGCSGFMGDLTIPNSVTEISSYAFSGCSGFTGNLTIPNSVTTIGYGAFQNCSGFTGKLTIPNAVTVIGNTTFYNCSGFTGELVIPNSVTEIGYGAFYSCSGFIGSLTIPNSVTTIGRSAFQGCSGFTGSLTIPNSVFYIGDYAFYGCIGLTEALFYNSNPPFLGEWALPYSFSIYVPYESLNTYKTATSWSSYRNRIFPMAYTTILGYGEGDGNYRFIASPLVENTDPTAVDNMITETPYDLYRFDQTENAEWQNYKAQTESFVLENGQGYLYANADEVNVIFKGEFNEDETKEVELAYEANADFAGWNLVGNPFPVSAYANKSYYTMNEAGTAVEPNAVSSATAIPTCTGVMVKADDQGETVVFNTTAPEAASNKGSVQIALSQVVDRGGVSTSSTTLQDKAIVSFNAGDRLEKFVFNKDNARISIPQGGKDLAIACAEKQGELPLNFKAVKNGTYTLSVDVENADVDYLHLIDNLTGADIDLLQMPDYVFTAKMTDYASRFRLVFNANEMDDPSTGSGTFAFINNGNIIVTDAEAGAMLQMVDVTGRIIVCRDAARHVSTSGMTPGVYVLRLIHSNDVKTQRIVID